MIVWLGVLRRAGKLGVTLVNLASTAATGITTTVVFHHYYDVVALATVGMFDALETLFKLVAIRVELIYWWSKILHFIAT